MACVFFQGADAPAALIRHEAVQQNGPTERWHKHDLKQPPSQPIGDGEDHRLFVDRIEKPQRRRQQAEKLLEHCKQ